MATSQSTVDHLTAQMAGAGSVRNRKMFGEYALYCDDKVVALVCHEALFLKPTDAGREFIGSVEEAPPYPGSKDYFLIPEDRWEDAVWLAELIAKTAAALPKPAKKK